MAEEIKNVENIDELIKYLAESYKEEEEAVEEIEHRIVHPLSIRHRNLLSLMRESTEHIEEQEKLMEKLEELEKKLEEVAKKGEGEKAFEETIEEEGEIYKKVFEKQKEIDSDFGVSAFTIIYILRHLQMYYKKRLETLSAMVKLGELIENKTSKQELKKEIEDIRKINKSTGKYIQYFNERIQAAESKRAPQGVVNQAAVTLMQMCILEGVEGWKVKRRGEKKTAGEEA